MANISKIKLGNEVRTLRDNASLHFIGAIATLPASSETTITTDMVSGHIIAVYDHIIVGTGRANYVCTAITSNPTAVTWTLISEAAAEIPVQSVKVNGTTLTPDGNHVVNIPAATASDAVSAAFGVVETGAHITNTDGVISVPEASTSVKGVVQLADEIDSESATADTDVPTVAAVATAINNLPEPMVFKGTVGTDGTVDWTAAEQGDPVLPPPSAETVGFTYKVITAHDTTPICKVGDTIICADPQGDGTYEWVVVPSGDEPSGTVTSVGLAAQANSNLAIVSGSPITSSGTITIGVAADHTIPTDTKISGWDATKTQVDAFSNSSAVTDVSTTAPESPATATTVQLLEMDSTDTEQLNINPLYVYANATAVFGTIPTPPTP